MLRNPEFIRNTWTELTLKKLAALPLLLLTAYWLAYVFNDYLPAFFLPGLCLFFYSVFTFVWGTRLASETVVKEINSNTWSFQIMTSMSPLKMAVGKLFGSTIYIWYGNLICFVLYILSFELEKDRLGPVSNSVLLTNILIFALIGLCAQILPLLVSLHSIRWRHFFEKFDLTFFQLTGIITAYPLYLIFFSPNRHDTVWWYGNAYGLKEIVIILAVIFLIWGFIAVVNQIKTEFGQEPYPLAWLLFTLSLAAILFGFNNGNDYNPLLRYKGSLMAFFAVLGITYLTLCGESNMALRPHMILKYYRTSQYKRLLMIMPRSLITLPVILGLALILSAEFTTAGEGPGLSMTFMTWAMIMFMLRDFCFIYLWSLFAQGNEKETTVVPVLIALSTYTIIPALLYHFNLKIFCPFFMPYFHQSMYLTYNESAFLTLVPPTLEFVLMLALLLLGIQRKIRLLQDL